jgi:hypothetical protein
LEKFSAKSALFFAVGPTAPIPQPAIIAPTNPFSPDLFPKVFGAAALKGGLCI